MSDRLILPSDDELAVALRTLGPRVSYPQTPNLVPGVRQGIHPAARPAERSLLPVRRLVAVAAVLLALALGAVLLYPETRSTVAGWLSIPGVTFFFDEHDVPVYGAPLQLGEPLTLEDARDRSGFEILIADTGWLGEPDEVYLDARSTGGVVSLVYHANGQIPESEQTGVGILLSQFQGRLNPGMYGKGVPDGVTVEWLEINGQDAYWVSGEPHPLYFARDSGVLLEEHIRMAGNTLLWQHGDITLRLESALDRDTAVEIAESMR